MARRAIWKGYIHFGTVEVPVKLHSAVTEDRIQFNLLHSRDHVKLKQQMICAYEKVPVPPDEQIKGVELAEGKYILIEPEELELTEPKDNRTITVHEFVKTEQIDPMFFDRAYYLQPDISSQKYTALVIALREKHLTGICTWTMRKRSYFGALGVLGKILRLNILRYADDVISAKSLGLPSIPLSEKELTTGINLVNQLTGPFQPEKFENDHQKKLQNLIDQKAHGEKIAILRPRRLQPTTTNKLLDALEASLKKATT
jgi:DNA end-binding protein Ku